MRHRISIGLLRTICVALTLGAVPAVSGPQALSLTGRVAATNPDVSAPQLTKADLQAWLDGFFPYALQSNDIAGVVVLVVKNGEIMFQKGYGYADLGKRTPMDPQRTIVGVGSVSKVFTWTAVMQLVEQGKLDLDRDVNDYLDFRIPPAFGQPITVRNLMTHTAGFEERIKSYHRPGTSPRSLGAYLREVPPPTRVCPPGKVVAYSNYGANLAGYIVERISGEPFPDYIQHHILAPLQMTRSSFWPMPANLQPDVAKYYGLASSGKPLPPEANDDEPVGEPAGALFTTAADMSRFMLAHLQHGRYVDAQIVSPATEAIMQSPAFTPLPGAPPLALGFFREDYNGHAIIAHDGDSSGFHTDMQLLLDEHMGFFTCVNSDGTGGLLPAGSILRTALFHQFMNRYFPASAGPRLPTLPTANEHARQAAGEYEMSRRPHGTFMKAFYLAVRLHIKANRDGTIETPALFNLDGNGPQKWREVAPYLWQEVDGSRRLAMVADHGRVTAWAPADVGGFVCESVPFLLSATLNLPLLFFAIIVMFLSVLCWPVAAVARRHYGQQLALSPTESRFRRLAQLAVVTGLVFVGGWLALIVDTSGSFSGFHVGLDPWIRVVQLVGLLCVPGAAAAVGNLWLSCTGRRPMSAKIGNLVLTLALLVLIWFSFAFSLVSWGLNY